MRIKGYVEYSVEFCYNYFTPYYKCEVKIVIAKNFKFLRKHFHDTQKKLAEMFHVSQSCISEYSTGKKPIPVDVLSQIALRYNVSIDDLTTKDLSLEYDSPQTFDLDSVVNVGDKMLPFRTSNKAKNNDNFNRAYETIKSFEVENVDAFYGKIAVLEHAVKLFQKAWEEAHTYVALSNSVSTVLLIYIFYNQHGIKIGEQLLSQGKITTFDIESSLLRDPNKSTADKYANNRKAFFEKYEALVYGNIKLLKENLRFSELGDYFLAMCYCLGFVEDSVEYELSVKIGMHMLDQLCKIENKYAENFIESF